MLIGLWLAPVGIVTVNDVVVAAVTLALTPPKNTMLFAGTGLKFVPEILTDVPIGPAIGATEVMVGWPEVISTRSNSATKTGNFFFKWVLLVMPKATKMANKKKACMANMSILRLAGNCLSKPFWHIPSISVIAGYFKFLRDVYS